MISLDTLTVCECVCVISLMSFSLQIPYFVGRKVEIEGVQRMLHFLSSGGVCGRVTIQIEGTLFCVFLLSDRGCVQSAC